jgi:hypothetical protein
MNIKRKKFEEFANRRTNNAINSIRLIGKLSNKNAYEFDNEDINKIIRVLQNEIRLLKSRFEDSKNKESESFKL